MAEDVAWQFHLSNCTGFCTCEKGQEKQIREFPYEDGDVTVLGPGTFVSADRGVLSLNGHNYVRQAPLLKLVEELQELMEAANSIGDNPVSASYDHAQYELRKALGLPVEDE
jgi:hypothetical protein